MSEFSKQYNNRLSWQLGRLHLRAEIGGKTLGYSYIRKNGCSSFKEAMGFSRKHDVRDLQASLELKAWQRCDALIFVYRDPIARMKSLYQNKFIDRDGHEDITATFERAMPGCEATFSNFLEFSAMMKDPHCYTQRSHLFPRHYEHAIRLENLHAAMVEIVGTEAAEPFRIRKNPSQKAEFTVTDKDIARIREIYREDFSMIEQLETQQFEAGKL